ncbi:F0F1 ATP synthase subunit I [Coxiella endosymbiont of Ornithodoros amblus]|nr:ATP synthase subunit I [Coxiella endosymbiont of Ornithodoros amblus]MBW5802414.1 F0F1 ATP synthase subunit I [Coxiella endosymbiont of Ornithodoros amblus]
MIIDMSLPLPLKIYILAKIVTVFRRRGFLRQKSSGDLATRYARGIAYRFVRLQALVVVIIAAGWWISGATEVLSALLGGAACVIPSFYFARRLFATTSPRAVKRILVAFYLGKLINLALSAGLVVLIVLFIPVAIVPFIVGFVGAQFGFWLAPLLIKFR